MRRGGDLAGIYSADIYLLDNFQIVQTGMKLATAGWKLHTGTRALLLSLSGAITTRLGWAEESKMRPSKFHG